MADDDIDYQRILRRREIYRQTGVTFGDKVINGFWVVSVHTRDGRGLGAAKRTSKLGGHTKATELAIQNHDRKVEHGRPR